ncbi:MAG: hypothetical protein IPJ98_00305 [Bryobacterales bacterium]|nr:hypothetical protein [Bryobacterales bacterium]
MPLRFFCKIPTAGYVELEIADAGGRVLYLDGIVVKAVRDVAALATPDEWIIWNLRRASDWPSEVRARLTVSYTASEPAPAVFAVTSENTGSSFKWPAAGQAAVSVVSTPGGQSVFQGREQMPGGMPSLERWAARLDPGLYVLRLHCDRDPSEMAILLRAPAKVP